jgi:hypothetical protein
MEAFSNFLPSLQALADAKVSCIAMECSVYSLDQCELLMQLVLQTIIALVNKNQDSPDKIEQITALLIATRADEVVDALGRIGMLNKLAGTNVKITKGGSYFKELMKGGFKKNSKQPKKTQKGGASCAEQCVNGTDCTDNMCPLCVSGQCTGNQVVVHQNPIQTVTMSPGIISVGQALNPYPQNAPQWTVATQGQINAAMVADTATVVQSLGVNLANMQTGALNAANIHLTAALKSYDTASENLTQSLRDAENRLNVEFDTILAKNKATLQGLTTSENAGAVVGAASGAISGYKFSGNLISGIEGLTGGVGGFFYWLILSAKTLLENVPFASRVIPAFNTRCYASNDPFGKIWPVSVETKETIQSFSYSFKNKWTGTVVKLSAQAECFDSDAIYERIGECVQGKSTKMEDVCVAFPNLNIGKNFSKNIEVTCAALGLVLGGLFLFYMVKILRLQTKLHEFNLGKSGSAWWLLGEGTSDVAKIAKWGTGVGLAADIILPGQERSELVRMVQNSEVKHENTFKTKVEFIRTQIDVFKESETYKLAVTSKATALQTYEQLRRESLQLQTQVISGAMQFATIQTQQITNVAMVALGQQQQIGNFPQGQGQQQIGNFPQGQGQQQIGNFPQQGQQQIGNSPPPGGGKRLKFKTRKTRKTKKRGTRKNRKYSYKRK